MNNLKEKFTQIELNDLYSIIDFFKDNDSYKFFRGQSKSEWVLIPKIARKHEEEKSDYGWGSRESFLLDDFKKYSIPYIKKEPQIDIEWLVIGQHYGLPTRLLDWTTNLLKATYFSVSENQSCDGALYALSPLWFLDNLYEENTLDSFDKLTFFFPRMIDTRIIVQEACFSVFPLPPQNLRFESLENYSNYGNDYNHLIKIIIRKDLKEGIRNLLNKFGINDRTLFPDLHGLSSFLAWEHKLI